MTPDQLLATAQAFLGPDGVKQLRHLLGQQLPVATVEAEPAQDKIAVHEMSMIKLLREFAAQQDEGKQLVSLLGKFHRFAQASVNK